MPSSELPGNRKTAGQPEKQTRLFFGLSGGFSLCACAQQGQLRWPARKRGTALLFRFAFAAFTAKNGVSLLLSLTQREKSPRPPSPPSISVCRLNPSGDKQQETNQTKATG